MSKQFPLFSSQQNLAQQYWKALLKENDWVIDATCGNGKDSLFLSHLIPKGVLITMDIQEQAILHTQTALGKELSEGCKVFFYQQSHETFPLQAYQHPIKLIVYNLGYLPKGDKSITTLSRSTLTSLETALDLVSHGGMISLSCYPGHAEGSIEEIELIKFCSNLSPDLWAVCYHKFINRSQAPSLIILQKQKQ
ncbi:MAG: tRNA (mnm(5)s(2)U34)-methyltransferase [Rhabdochlamydiaceae bacterium]